jgi:RIO kinase 1
MPMSDKEFDDMLVEKVDKRRERVRDKSDRQAQEAVMSPRISKIIFNLIGKGKITKIIGILNAGKEANVYNGIGGDGREIAIKVYRINSQTSKWMQEYIRGDPRFTNYRKGNSTTLMTTWAMKEFKNLKRAREAGVPVPEPLYVEFNLLVMGFIGKDGTTETQLEDPLKHLNTILHGIQDLFIKARLIHADLSAFNILYHEDKIYFIDFGQAVLADHPNARKYFDRDMDNVLGYFSGVLPENFDRNDLVNAIIAGKPFQVG